MQPLEPVPLSAVKDARARNAGGAIRTPLVPLDLPSLGRQTASRPRLFLKLESLQPIGSFKLRGAGQAMAAAGDAIERGVVTASVGNMAIGVAWNARKRGVPCHVVVPYNAPEHKIHAIEELGATVLRVPFADWWTTIVEHHHPGLEGVFIHPVSNPAILAGNGVIGLEILEDLPDVDAILTPFGGGGLSCGIACAVHAHRPDVRVYAAEVKTAAPVAAAWAAGRPVKINYTPTFVEGVGGRSVLEDMWPLVRRELAGSIVVDLEEVAQAVRLMAEHARIVAEGAAATTLAAALRGEIEAETLVCVISGGRLGLERLAAILRGEIPPPG